MEGKRPSFSLHLICLAVLMEEKKMFCSMKIGVGLENMECHAGRKVLSAHSHCHGSLHLHGDEDVLKFNICQ